MLVKHIQHDRDLDDTSAKIRQKFHENSHTGLMAA